VPKPFVQRVLAPESLATGGRPSSAAGTFLAPAGWLRPSNGRTPPAYGVRRQAQRDTAFRAEALVAQKRRRRCALPVQSITPRSGRGRAGWLTQPRPCPCNRSAGFQHGASVLAPTRRAGGRRSGAMECGRPRPQGRFPHRRAGCARGRAHSDRLWSAAASAARRRFPCARPRRPKAPSSLRSAGAVHNSAKRAGPRGLAHPIPALSL
jgi:hypothetical protein